MPANAAGTLAEVSVVWTRASCALTPDWPGRRKRCSKRTCGSHNHKLPAAVSGETPTWASESGSRNEASVLSWAIVRLRVDQSIPKLAVRMRSRLFSGWLVPPKKSMNRDPRIFPFQSVCAPR